MYHAKHKRRAELSEFSRMLGAMSVFVIVFDSVAYLWFTGVI